MPLSITRCIGWRAEGLSSSDGVSVPEGGRRRNCRRVSRLWLRYRPGRGWRQGGQAAQDPAIAALVGGHGSVYFTGGDQALITGALAPFGKGNPSAQAIRKMQRKGSLVVGRAPGPRSCPGDVFWRNLAGNPRLMVWSKMRISPECRSHPGSILSLGDRRPAFHQARPVWPDGRVRRRRAKRGPGIDENTALFVEGRSARVIGEYGVFVFDLEAAKVDVDRRLIENIVFSWPPTTGTAVTWRRVKHPVRTSGR